MTKLYANPYCTTLVGFYFDSLDEYEEKLAEAKEQQGSTDFEHEIEFIDGNNPDLFRALHDEFQDWLAAFLEYDEEENEDIIEKIEYLMLNKWYEPCDKSELDSKVGEVHMISGDDLEDYFLEILCLPKGFNVNYIDFEAIKTDWYCSGDLVEYGNNYIMNDNCL